MNNVSKAVQAEFCSSCSQPLAVQKLKQEGSHSMFESCNSSMVFLRKFKLKGSVGEGTFCLVMLLLLEAAACAGLSNAKYKRPSKGRGGSRILIFRKLPKKSHLCPAAAGGCL